jgi:hypothetical protein
VVAGGAIALVQVRQAERAAVAQADVAGREAARARQAEDQVRRQLEVIRREQAAKSAAESQVERGKQDLRVANTDLQKAVVRAEAESARAKDEAARASGLADSLQQSNAHLEKLLADERARALRLEGERRKITSELR